MKPPIIFAADAKYPMDLKVAESAELAARRRVAGVDLNAPQVGFALSGGGIRSATFCIGLFQALARQRLIRRIDFLSTVSGGGYFGSFLGAGFSREDGSPERIENELANNTSWSVNWLRENGRFLSPNDGDNWHAAAVALRNWVTLQIVLLTFCFVLLGLGALVRADLGTWSVSQTWWLPLEQFFWEHPAANMWWSPWMVLPAIPLVLLMIPSGTLYWLTQALPLMNALRWTCGLVRARFRKMTDVEFASRAQGLLTRTFMLGLMATVFLLVFAAIDSIGQTIYLRWSANNFTFPALWTFVTGLGAGAFGFGTKIAIYVERFLGKRRFRIPFDVVALLLAFTWLGLIIVGLSVVACGFAWQWSDVWDDAIRYRPMSGNWQLLVAVGICFVASWIFSRAFGFVNLSSLQQTYAARLARAYLGGTNPDRRRHENHDMTELLPGDDVALEDYAPQRHGGPLHLVNVTVNETLSGKTQIERRDRKGLAMAVGPCGVSVGGDSHALWTPEPPRPSGLARVQALWETRLRPIKAIDCASARFHALCDHATQDHSTPQRIEALALGRWVAISGAAFTTGTGANTSLGLSLLLGLANVRLGYWWDSGIKPGKHGEKERPKFIETLGRLASWLLPVQTCLTNEFLARFHGPCRRHWYLSDGGHFENTACYELIRRRVPLIFCTDAGQDARYQFGDFANLVRKARTDFHAEIQVVRRATDIATDDPGVRFPMPKLEEIVHPSLLDVIGVPEDFESLTKPDDESEQPARSRFSRRHAILARIHYLDNDQFSWLVVIKPSLMGDEATDVVQYHHTHPLFPQEPTSDQQFDEAQWESYRKLGEHIGVELFTPPAATSCSNGAAWSPSSMTPPQVAHAAPPAHLAMAG